MSIIQDSIFEIAQRLCGDVVITPLDKCFEKNHNSQHICSHSSQCQIKLLTNEQIDYIASDIFQSSYLEACPGSGKTHVLGFKAAYEISRWSRDISGIAFLSFTRNAAKEIRERARIFCSASKLSYPHYIGTFDSWLHGYLFQPFIHKIINFDKQCMQVLEDNEMYSFLFNKKYQLKTHYHANSRKCIPIYVNNISYDLKRGKYICNVGKQKLTVSQLYKSIPQSFLMSKTWLTEDMLTKDINRVKRVFWQDGFVTYNDVERLSVCLLHNTNISTILSERFPVIYIDECQDLSYSQLLVLDILETAGSKIHLIGDLNQSIYEFRDTCPEDIRSHIDNKGLISKYLKINHRSNPAIVKCCNQIIHNKASITGNVSQNVENPLILIKYSRNNIRECLTDFQKIIDKEEISATNAIVLVRSHSLLSDLSISEELQSSKDVRSFINALILYSNSKDNMSTDTLKTILRNCGSFVGPLFYNCCLNSKENYCPESVQNYEWRIILISLLDNSLENGLLNDPSLTLKVWLASILKPFLKSNTFLFPRRTNGETKIDNLKSPKHQGSKIISSFGAIHPVNSSDIQLTTIHQVKGKTYDAVMLISAKYTRSDGHYSYWLKDDIDESVRLAYVASSRPRKILVWAVPDGIKVHDEQKIFSLGFTPER